LLYSSPDHEAAHITILSSAADLPRRAYSRPDHSEARSIDATSPLRTPNP